MQRYWALAANPKNYRIEDAVNNLEVDTWTTGGSEISKGDRVVIWKTLGESKNRGIICLGDVISDAETGDDNNNPYWVNRDMANQSNQRVLVRYVRAPGLPLWVGDDRYSFLESLSVARSQGGTVFKLTPIQWELIINAVGLSTQKQNSYWWVNHKQTFRSEIDGGYIWSPKTNRTGATNQTYINMTLTRPGDTVISYANGKISAIGVVTSFHREQKKPSEFGKAGDTWANTGWIVPIEWTLLEKPIIPKDYLNKISPLLPEKYSPIQKNGNGNQTFYLAAISNELGDLIVALAKKDRSSIPGFILDVQNETEADQEEATIQSLDIGETEKEQLVKSRRGQGLFRLNVERIESGCRITKITNKRFLIASHIKPWKDSTNSERLDGNNGLLLSPHIDKLFDGGWISFTDLGEILCVDTDGLEVIKDWGLNVKMNVGSFSPAQRKYLEYHRNEVYNKRSKTK